MDFIVHNEPVLRSESNYIARIDLAPFELAGQVEQVWLRRADGNEAVLCCIPFRAYGLASRDTVRLSPENYVIGLVGRSGHRTLRALIADLEVRRVGEIKAEIEERISRTGLLSEWSGDRHVAIAVPAGAVAGGIMDLFEVFESVEQLCWEWSDVEPFRS